MKVALYHSLLFIFLLAVQISFLDVLFPDFLVPLIILSAVVVWTVGLGFRQALWYLLPLLILYEVLVVGGIHLLSIYGVLLAYGTSFLSRRMLIENSILASLFYALGIISSACLYQWITQEGFHKAWSLPSFTSILFQILIAIPVFLLTRKILFAFQARMDTLRSDRALMIR